MKNYEQAMDEAAEKYAIYEYGEILGLASKLALKDFKAGADFGRTYADEKYAIATKRNVELDVENLDLKQKVADLLADCKAMKEALELANNQRLWNKSDFDLWVELRENNKKTISQIKGKYDE